MTRKVALWLLIFSIWSFLKAYSQENKVWIPDLKMKKTTWLPGEPVFIDVTVIQSSASVSSFNWGQIYLDDSSKRCLDRNTPIEADAVSIPEEGTGERTANTMQSPGPIQSMQVNISRICNMEISDTHLIGSHTVCYVQPPNEKSCLQFEITQPQGADLAVYSSFPKTLRDVLSDINSESAFTDILQKYPNSNYSAYLLWKLGNAVYTPMKEIGAEKDFQSPAEYKERNSEAMFESYRKHLQGAIGPWEQLYRNFPDFIFRPELLYALSRLYFHAGEPEKAIPFLQELERNYKNTEPAKKAENHVKALKDHKLWNY